MDDTCTERGRSPEVFPDKNVLLSMFVSMFLHGGWLHLGGNMLFLWVFGNNVEDKLGWFFYLLLYLVGGRSRCWLRSFEDPNSTVPVIGASGAIATVMGAYLVWFPRARVLTVFLIFFFFPFELPALAMLDVLVRDCSSSPDHRATWRLGGPRRRVRCSVWWSPRSFATPSGGDIATSPSIGGYRRRPARRDRAQPCQASVRPSRDVSFGDTGEDERKAIPEHTRQPAVGVGPVADDDAGLAEPLSGADRPSARTACLPPLRSLLTARWMPARIEPAPGIGPSAVG